MQLSGPRSRMGVRFGLLLALWRWVQSSRTCWGFRWLSFGSSATSGRASRLTSSSRSLQSGHGLIHGGPSCWASCAVCPCYLMTACIFTFSEDNIADAKGPLPCANWARGIEVKFAALGMASPFVSSGIGALDSHGFMARLAGARQRTWDGLHVAPRAAPSKGAKLCTYHHWFGRPNKVHCEPYYELPMSITRLRALVQFRLGSHSLPVEQGRFVRPCLPRHLRRCDLCNTQAVGDELHYVFDCPRFGAIRAQYSNLFQDAEGSMRLFMWHKDQKAVSHCLTAILQMAQT